MNLVYSEDDAALHFLATNCSHAHERTSLILAVYDILEHELSEKR